jgi:hypothetical protein
MVIVISSPPPVPVKRPSTSPTPPTTPTAREQVRRPAPNPQSFGALLRTVGGNAPATSDTAAGRRKLGLLDAREKARKPAKSWSSSVFDNQSSSGN